MLEMIFEGRVPESKGSLNYLVQMEILGMSISLHRKIHIPRGGGGKEPGEGRTAGRKQNILNCHCSTALALITSPLHIVGATRQQRRAFGPKPPTPTPPKKPGMGIRAVQIRSHQIWCRLHCNTRFKNKAASTVHKDSL